MKATELLILCYVWDGLLALLPLCKPLMSLGKAGEGPLTIHKREQIGPGKELSHHFSRLSGEARQGKL